MADLALTVTTLTPLEEPERGWCDPCAKPSLLRWHLSIEADGRLLGDALTALTICTDCGRENWT